MKPKGAFTSISLDLTQLSLEDALIKLECYPLCILRVASNGIFAAQRVIQSEGISPRIDIVMDVTYAPDEWSVEYNGKVFWSEGAI